MNLNEKLSTINILCNFDIKFNFIRDHMKSYEFFCVEPFLKAWSHDPTLEIPFLRTGDVMTRL
jgi:hypothetical protein